MYKIYTATIDNGAIMRHNSLRAKRELIMKNLEPELLPISKLHWDCHKIVAIKSDIGMFMWYVFEVVGKGKEQQSNYIGRLTWVEVESILSMIANEQDHYIKHAGLSMISIKYVE